MPTNPAEPIVIDGTATLRRPGRALIGWMTTDQGAIALAGGEQAGSGREELRARVEQARANVASRTTPISQDDLVDESHPDPDLDLIRQRLAAQENTAAFWNEGWEVATVDLSRVLSLQQSVASQQARERVASIDPESLSSIADVTLPPPSTTELPAQLDQARNAWIISAPNPNLRITGHFGGPVQEGHIGFGFIVAVLPSFLQVARHHGRYVLRDGYHRAFGLLARGIIRAPAFVRDYGVGDLGTGAGLFSTDVYLGDNPPRLSDFLNDQVAADVDVPIVQKMLVVQGLELTPLA
jgi:hypothetical protein